MRQQQRENAAKWLHTRNLNDLEPCRRLLFVLKACANACNNTQDCWASIVVSCCAMCANACKKSQHVGSLAKLSTQTSNLRLHFSNVNVQNVSHLLQSSFAFVSHVVVLFVAIPQAVSFLKKIDQLIDFRLHQQWAA